MEPAYCRCDQGRHLKVKSSRGQVLVEFIFAVSIAVGVGSILFVLAYSLMVIEIAQYIAFATARALALSHLSPSFQAESAQRKFEYLTQRHPQISTLFNNRWFSVGNLETAGGDGQQSLTVFPRSSFARDYNASPDSERRGKFLGVRFSLQLPILRFKIPFLGYTFEEDGATTRLTGFLIREPSEQECRDFFSERSNLTYWRKIIYEPVPVIMSPERMPLGDDNGC